MAQASWSVYLIITKICFLTKPGLFLTLTATSVDFSQALKIIQGNHEIGPW